MNFFKTVAGLVTGAGAAVVAGVTVSLLGMTAFDFHSALVLGAVLGTSLVLLNIVEPQKKAVSTFLGGGMAACAYIALTSAAAMTLMGAFGAVIMGAFVGWLVVSADAFNGNKS